MYVCLTKREVVIKLLWGMTFNVFDQFHVVGVPFVLSFLKEFQTRKFPLGYWKQLYGSHLPDLLYWSLNMGPRVSTVTVPF